MKLFYTLLLWILFILSLPLQFFVAVAVFISEGMPIIFAQQRIGKNGKPFTIYKFRTMQQNAELQKKYLLRKNESTGPVFKIHDDPRFMGLGKFLSHTGLDELPQLWNVVLGEMALIGPRPLPISEEKKLSAWMKERETVLPGIISPAILTGKYHKSFEGWMKNDITYIRTKTFFSDTVLLLQFIPFIFSLLIKEVKRYLS